MKPVAANDSVTLEQLLDGLKAIDDDKHIKNHINQIIAKLRRLNLDDELNNQRNQILSDVKKSTPRKTPKNIYFNTLIYLNCYNNAQLAIENRLLYHHTQMNLYRMKEVMAKVPSRKIILNRLLIT